jgi:hypothetical protein
MVANGKLAMNDKSGMLVGRKARREERASVS